MTKPRKTTLATAIAGAVLSLAGISTSALAQTEPTLVKDVNTSEYIVRSMRSQPFVIDGIAYFRGAGGYYRTDGTEAGTSNIKLSGPYHSIVGRATGVLIGDKFYFNNGYDESLSVSEIPKGVSKVLVHPGTGLEFDEPEYLTAFDGELYFTAYHTSNRHALWRSDGDRVYLVKIFDRSVHVSDMATIDGKLYVWTGEDGLWVKDSPSKDLRLLTDGLLGYGPGGQYLVSDTSGRFYFTDTSRAITSLWQSDGTVAGTYQLLAPGIMHNDLHQWLNISGVNGEMYFIATTPDDDFAVYKTNGKEEPEVVSTLHGLGSISDIKVLDNQALILADTGLWVTDGSEQGTVQLLSASYSTDERDIINTLTEHQSELYFFADSGDGYGQELWKTDGTIAGTVMVKDIAWQASSSSPHYLTSLDAGLLFQANQGNDLGGDSIWITNGTAGTTEKVLDLAYSTKDANPSMLTEFNGEIFFTAAETWNEYLTSLWKTDGTEAGTVKLGETSSGGIPELDQGKFSTLGDYLYFTARDYRTNTLMRTDGTAGGIEALTDIFPSYTNGDVKASLIVMNNSLFFLAETGTGVGLWQLVDGATSATLIADGFSSVSSLTEINGVLYFVNNDNELWRSKGSEATTVLVETVDITDDVRISEIRDGGEDRVLLEVEWNYNSRSGGYFSGAIWLANSEATGARWLAENFAGVFPDGRLIYWNNSDGLYVSKGSGQGNQLVLSADDISLPEKFTQLGDTFYFESGGSLWQTDGTAAGTRAVANNLEIASMFAVGNNLLFSAYDVDASGNTIGELSIRAIKPGSANVQVLAENEKITGVISNDLFTSAEQVLSYYGDIFDGDSSLWQTDGSPGNTKKLIADFEEDNETLVVNDRLYFSALFNNNAGRELYLLPLNGSDASNTGTGQIGDYVWSDTNGDGVQDADEPGLAGVAVNLWQGCTSSNVLTTTTDQNGAFLFNNLPVDDYQLEFVTPNGYILSPNYAAGDYTRDSNPDPSTGLDRCQSLAKGQVRNALDAGFTPDGDTLIVKQAVYYSANNKLWLKALSDAEPEGVATLTATAVKNGVETKLGEIYFKSHKNAYQHMFKNVTQAPDKIIVTSDMGGSVVVDVVLK